VLSGNGTDAAGGGGLSGLQVITKTSKREYSATEGGGVAHPVSTIQSEIFGQTGQNIWQ